MRLRMVLPLVSALLATCLASASQAAEKGFFWKVTGEKGVAYLLGTVHVGDKDLYPLAPIIEDSFAKSDVLIEEIDLNSAAEMGQAAQNMIRTGLYPSGDTVDNHVGEATRNALAEYTKGGRLDAVYKRARPWLLSLLIAQQQLKDMGLDKAKGLDRHFADEAVQMKKPIEGLETAAYQVQMFSAFSDALQDQLLLSTLVDAQRSEEVLKRTLAAWRTGDDAAMEAVLTGEIKQYPFLAPVMEKLIYERNDAMTRKIDTMLQTPKVYFVAVGAGHLVGPRGIVSQLRARNYAIERP